MVNATWRIFSSWRFDSSNGCCLCTHQQRTAPNTPEDRGIGNLRTVATGVYAVLRNS